MSNHFKPHTFTQPSCSDTDGGDTDESGSTDEIRTATVASPGRTHECSGDWVCWKQAQKTLGMAGTMFFSAEGKERNWKNIMEL